MLYIIDGIAFRSNIRYLQRIFNNPDNEPNRFNRSNSTCVENETFQVKLLDSNRFEATRTTDLNEALDLEMEITIWKEITS